MNLAAVYSREIDGKILTLSASGWTYRWTFGLFDYETESLCYPLEAEEGLTGINGFHAGRNLPALESTFTRWDAWKEQNRDTQLLKYP